MFYILAFLFLFGINAIPVYFGRLSFGKAMPLSYACSAIILYFFGLLNNLYLGYCVLWLLIILNLISLFTKRKKLETFKSDYFSYGMLAFVLILVICFVFYNKRGFENCDEYMHWGPMVKAMFNTNKFYSHPNDILSVHRDYPPFFSLIELLFCFLAGRYNESFLYIGLISFMFSLFMPLFDTDKKDIYKTIPVFVVMIFMGLLVGNVKGDSDYAYVYNSIYVDWVLFVFIAYIVFYIYKIKTFKLIDFVYLTVLNTALLLSKQIGIVFFLMIGFYAVLKLVYLDKGISFKGNIKYYFISAVASFLISRTWTILIKFLEINGQFSSNLSIGRFVSILRWLEPERWRSEVFFDYLYRISHAEFVLGLTFIKVALLITVLIIVASWLKKEGLFVAGLFVITTIGYTVLLGAMYSMQFSIEEAVELASFNRYMGSFLYFGAVLIFYLVSDNLILNNKVITFVVLAVIMFMSIGKDNYEFLKPLNEDTVLGDVVVVKQYEDGINLQNNENYGRKFNYIFADADRIRGMDDIYLKELLGSGGYLYIQCYDQDFYRLWMDKMNSNEVFAGYMYGYEKINDGYNLLEQNSNFLYYVLKYSEN